jgi:hypothetical protein
MKTQKERDQEKRKAKLAEIKRNVASGSLVIRSMTKAERAKYPPRESTPTKRRR